MELALKWHGNSDSTAAKAAWAGMTRGSFERARGEYYRQSDFLDLI